LAKTDKKEAAFIDDPQRCVICNTNLTLYPKDFAPCPHCQKRVCRQCWGQAWISKSFTADACAHISVNDGLTMAPIVEKQGFTLDWPKAIVIAVLGALAIGTIILIFNLFVF